MAFRTWQIEEDPGKNAGVSSSTVQAGGNGGIEDAAYEILLQVRDQIILGGIWKYSPEVEAAGREIDHAFQELVVGAVAGDLSGIRKACEVWKTAGTGRR
jgi:hypothetical protein